MHNPQHDAAGVWSHLVPVLSDIAPISEVNTLRILTDGPTTQYRNRSNFALTQMLPFRLGYKKVVWNFLEAGHGKGAADGIGAVAKRTADRLISQGTSISTPPTLYRALIPHTTVKLYYVEDDEFCHTRAIFKSINIPETLPNTMRLHQLIYTDDDGTIIQHREVSCYCSWPEMCKCYDIKKTNFKVNKQPVLVRKDDSNKNNARTSVSETTGGKESLSFNVSLSDDLINSYCMVQYNSRAYPGKIINISENDVEVDSMNRAGKNQYFWLIYADMVWYYPEDILGIILEPSKSGRHYTVSKHHHDMLANHYGNIQF